MDPERAAFSECDLYTKRCGEKIRLRVEMCGCIVGTSYTDAVELGGPA